MSEQLDSNKQIDGEVRPKSKSKLKSKPSFQSKNSMAKLNPSGSIARPIHRMFSHEKDPGMNDKFHSLMDSYIPKDIPSI